MKRKMISTTIAACLAGSVLMPMNGAAQAAEIGFISSQTSGEWLAIRLGGSTILSTKGEIIGRVEDVVVDANGQTQAVVIGVGGFLGVGQKKVAVPFKSIHIGNVVDSRRLIVLDVTKEQLLAAPIYKAIEPTRTDRAKQKVADWAKIAKDKAVELGKQATDAGRAVRDRVNPPSAEAPSPTPKK